ncbi:MAG TPA: efflux RND transporter periplasmic adaptor subunit [Planctomycetaceae bacterium]
MSYFPSLMRRLPNIAILAVLIGLGAWGHRQHWQMPKFADLTGTVRDADPAGENDSQQVRRPGAASRELASHSSTAERRSKSGEHAQPQEARHADNDLPIIRFRSAQAVQQEEIAVQPAQTRKLDEYVTANGVVEYDETRLAQLSPRVPGIAWRVEKRVGDPVHKGEVLAILDSSEVGKAKAELLEAVVTHDLKQENLLHLEKNNGAIPTRTIREARAEERTAGVRLFIAQQALINLGLPLPDEILSRLSDKERAARIQFLGIPPEMAARLGPDVVTANLIPLTAPFDGIVISREIVPGEVVQTGLAEFVIADVSHVWMRLNVRKADAARLAIGQEVWFESDGAPGEVRSRIAWIATEVDEKTRTVQVRAEADNPELETPAGVRTGQRLLRAHTFGTARIRVRQEPRAVVVPSSAIQVDRNRYLVFVPLPDGRSFEPRHVSIGVTNEHYTEIVQGLADDESVVTVGSYVLKAEFGRERSASSDP